MQKDYKLKIELVPKTSWGNNARSIWKSHVWQKVRLYASERSKNKCEICGGVGERHPVECHEVWEYDDENHIQRFVRLIALCPACHMVKHMGRAQVIGKLDLAIKQFTKVNRCTDEEAMEYIHNQFEQYHKRSEYEWDVQLEEFEEFRK